MNVNGHCSNMLQGYWQRRTRNLRTRPPALKLPDVGEDILKLLSQSHDHQTPALIWELRACQEDRRACKVRECSGSMGRDCILVLVLYGYADRRSDRRPVCTTFLLPQPPPSCLLPRTSSITPSVPLVILPSSDSTRLLVKRGSNATCVRTRTALVTLGIGTDRSSWCSGQSGIYVRGRVGERSHCEGYG
jgi:hypothetical protein